MHPKRALLDYLSGGLDGKESTCNAGYPGLILESRRSPGEGNGYPLSILIWRMLLDRGSWQATYSPWGHRVEYD